MEGGGAESHPANGGRGMESEGMSPAPGMEGREDGPGPRESRAANGRGGAGHSLEGLTVTAAHPPPQSGPSCPAAASARHVSVPPRPPALPPSPAREWTAGPLPRHPALNELLQLMQIYGFVRIFLYLHDTCTCIHMYTHVYAYAALAAKFFWRRGSQVANKFGNRYQYTCISVRIYTYV